MFFFDSPLLIIGILISIAFFTLIERKFLGYLHNRKGPSKIFFTGLLQSLSDFIKLFTKGVVSIKFSNGVFFLSGPFSGSLIMFVLWGFYVSFSNLTSWDLQVLFFFSVMSLISYFLFFCGMSVSSSYSYIGYMRSISQVISYEVCIFVCLLFIIYSFLSLSFLLARFSSEGYFYFLFFPFMLFVWMLILLGESNRSPFDFSEGESELVSGFNVEYFGGVFSIIFIVEYGMFMFMSYVSSWIFFASSNLIMLLFIFSLMILWARGGFPRYRYDKLMNTCWLCLAPVLLISLIILVEFYFNV